MIDCSPTHPDLGQLLEFVEGHLSSEDATLVEEHLVGCDHCLQVLEECPADTLIRKLRGVGRPTGRPLRLHRGYEILEELGRGGMGVVYRARQAGLDRTVALKMLHAGADAGPSTLARFHRESQASARLQHPHIVQVFEVGEQDGQPYLALELIEGTTLAVRLRGGPLEPRSAAGVVALLADAVGHAHERGVIHRDLKPSNVLLTADGSPKVADFGLAKYADAFNGSTATNAVLGSPSYMAPNRRPALATSAPRRISGHSARFSTNA